LKTDASKRTNELRERSPRLSGRHALRRRKSTANSLKQHLGQLPLLALEEIDEINRFRSESDCSEDVEVASVHRVVERLRAAINGYGADSAAVRSNSVPSVRRSTRGIFRATVVSEGFLQPAVR
jgi:hypothetical protein